MCAGEGLDAGTASGPWRLVPQILDRGEADQNVSKVPRSQPAVLGSGLFLLVVRRCRRCSRTMRSGELHLEGAYGGGAK